MKIMNQGELYFFNQYTNEYKKISSTISEDSLSDQDASDVIIGSFSRDREFTCNFNITPSAVDAEYKED